MTFKFLLVFNSNMWPNSTFKISPIDSKLSKFRQIKSNLQNLRNPNCEDLKDNISGENSEAICRRSVFEMFDYISPMLTKITKKKKKIVKL